MLRLTGGGMRPRLLQQLQAAMDAVVCVGLYVQRPRTDGGDRVAVGLVWRWLIPPSHLTLVLTTSWKVLQNGLKLFGNGVAMVITIYNVCLRTSRMGSDGKVARERRRTSQKFLAFMSF